MKKMIILPVLLLTGCVPSNVAVDYANRAHPECTDHQALNHSYSSGRNDTSGSQTEVQMTCDGQRKSITVKCIHGFGIVSDTTCHENN